MSATDTDQRQRLAALMADHDPGHDLHPSEFAPPETAHYIRKRLLVGDDIEARSLDGPEGTFEAVVSTWDTDRQNEAFLPGAFSDTIQRWRQSGKQLPVLFAHDAKDPNMLIGAVSPSEMHETSEGLHVRGRLDLESRHGREVYDLLKRGAPLGWSVGALILAANTVRDAGRTLIRRVSELMEISVTATPANGRVRTVSVKGIEAPNDQPEPSTHDEIEAQLRDHGLLPVTDIQEQERQHIIRVLNDRRRNGDEGHDDADTKAIGSSETFRGADGPVTIATFTC